MRYSTRQLELGIIIDVSTEFQLDNLFYLLRQTTRLPERSNFSTKEDEVYL